MSILQKLKYCYLSRNTRTLCWLNLSSHAKRLVSARNRNYVTFFIEKVSLFNRQKYKKAEETQNFHLPSVRNLFLLLLAHVFLSHLSIYDDIIEAIRIYHRIWRNLINHIWSTITRKKRSDVEKSIRIDVARFRLPSSSKVEHWLSKTTTIKLKKVPFDTFRYSIHQSLSLTTTPCTLYCVEK